MAQAVVAMHLRPITERRFHPDSYGYRPGRSAHEAVEQARVWLFRDGRISRRIPLFDDTQARLRDRIRYESVGVT